MAQGASALVSLVVLQFAVAWTSVRSRRVRRLVKTEPTLLRRPHAVRRAVRSAGYPDEVSQVARTRGTGGRDLVHAVVLETDGTFSVVPHAQYGSGDALRDLGRRQTFSDDAGLL